MAKRFNLLHLGVVITIVAAILGLAKHENVWLATGALACLVTWWVVGKLTLIFFEKVLRAPKSCLSLNFLRDKTPPLPTLAVAITLSIFAVSVMAAVQAESQSIANHIANASWLLVPGTWAYELILRNRSLTLFRHPNRR